MKYCYICLIFFLLYILLSACNNSVAPEVIEAEKMNIDSTFTTLPIPPGDSTIVGITPEDATHLENESNGTYMSASDTLPKPHKIVRREGAAPPKIIVREMPRPGVSELDKREIDSIKAARSKSKIPAR